MDRVLVDVSSVIAQVRLNFPTARSALRAADFEQLASALTLVGESGSRVLVLSGNGPSFCAGLDLVEGLGADSGAAERTMRLAQAFVAGVRELPQPVVAAAQGHVVGIGVAIALACDFVYASRSAQFSVPFVRLGLSAGDPSLAWLLPRVIGLARGRHLLLSGGVLSAGDAKDVGLVADVVDDPIQVALRTASVLALHDPGAVEPTKRLLLASMSGADIRSHSELEVLAQVECAQSESARHAHESFIERRRHARQDS